MNKPFKLFSNCIPVKGANRSTICDLQRNDVKLIPNDLVEILLSYEEKSITEIKKAYNNKYDSIIEEYFEFLLENEFIFFTSQPKLFPKLDLKWESPFIITNAIIDINHQSNYNILDIINQLDELMCKHIEIRFFNPIELVEAHLILKYLEEIESTIISIDIIMPNNSFSKKELNSIVNKYKRLASLKIFNSEEDNFVPPIRGNMGYIIYTKKEIKNNLCCGEISQDFFTVNLPLFTESKNYNNCLNRKVGIDVNGYIKNCPTLEENFGNIKNTTIKESLCHKEFKKYWNITKDQIDTCQDCEFRYICTDCRAFVTNTVGKFPKPFKCGYNPYTNKWN